MSHVIDSLVLMDVDLKFPRSLLELRVRNLDDVLTPMVSLEVNPVTGRLGIPVPVTSLGVESRYGSPR